MQLYQMHNSVGERQQGRQYMSCTRNPPKHPAELCILEKCATFSKQFLLFSEAGGQSFQEQQEEHEVIPEASESRPRNWKRTSPSNDSQVNRSTFMTCCHHMPITDPPTTIGTTPLYKSRLQTRSNDLLTVDSDAPRVEPFVSSSSTSFVCVEDLEAQSLI